MADLFHVASSVSDRSWRRVFSEAEVELIKEHALATREAFEAFVSPRVDGATVALLSSSETFAEDAPSTGKPAKRARQAKVHESFFWCARSWLT